MAKTPRKTSPRVASIAGKTMAGYEPTRAEVLALAGSALSQDQVKSKPRKKK